ncbi:MAG: C-terminal helicase domain-containing protein [candidate division KSB1 bacterium]|nr:C-terminal helicase domain-containing protein [candidate division KSB1 bacterium]
MSTDAGGLGLNLQCANIAINLDLPWNPARLEQRIARVYRLGQNQHAYIYNFISRDSIENRIYHLLGFKKSLFSGALDGEKDTVRLDDKHMGGFMETVETLTREEAQDDKSTEKKIKSKPQPRSKDKANQPDSVSRPGKNPVTRNVHSQQKKQPQPAAKQPKRSLLRRMGKIVTTFFKWFRR